ncbi:hypothetical protein KM043_012665 [Ampulex compressa]|nr:hypothetical protein KM043_012665 [Ampulex compressa]
MNEITDKNFKETLGEVSDAIKDANFIAIDAEFTGLKYNEEFKESLFDTCEERYEKLRRNIEPFRIVEFGISAFRHKQSENTYTVTSFNFYVMPKSILSDSGQISWQISALEFLAAHKFDFNKAICEGISYLSEKEEALLKQQLAANVLVRNVQRSVSYQDEDNLRNYSNIVADWLQTSPKNEASLEVKVATPLLQYLMHKELRNRFQNIWTLSGEHSVIIIKVPNPTRHALEEEEKDDLERKLLDYYIGFSHIFKLLVSLKIPIIGHNLLLDLMFLHQQFYKPLPQKYTEFKKTIHSFFPIIYDTKHLSYELKQMMDKEEKWKINSLSELYKYFQTGKGKHLTFRTPYVTLSKGTLPSSEIFHHAGWDSYYTGYIFTKMAHFFAVKKYGNGVQNKDVTNTELMNAVKNFANHVNVIRGITTHLRLDADDPESNRPEWLAIKSLENSTLNTRQIAETLSAYGTIDVMPFSKQRFLVAVANHASARAILTHFRHSKEFCITAYRPHRCILKNPYFKWGSLFLSGGMFAWMLHRSLHKSV